MKKQSLHTFAVGLLLWGWQVTRGQRTLREWALLGAVAGVMVMIRPQDGAFLLVFVVEAIAAPRKLTREWFLGVGAAAAAAPRANPAWPARASPVVPRAVNGGITSTSRSAGSLPARAT